MTPEEKLEWLWKNCNIVYYPKNGEFPWPYPVEHNPHAVGPKDNREAIERYMENPNGQAHNIS